MKILEEAVRLGPQVAYRSWNLPSSPQDLSVPITPSVSLSEALVGLLIIEPHSSLAAKFMLPAITAILIRHRLEVAVTAPNILRICS